jgi:hypothetical protein
MIYNTYTPTNWYWFVGNDQANVYSSALWAYVPITDATYAAWTATNKTTKIDSKESLVQVLTEQVLSVYFLKGMDVVSPNTPSLQGNYTLDQQSQNQITSISTSIAANRGLPGGDLTFFYQGHEFSADDFLSFAQAASNFVYQSNQSMQRIVYTGSGTMPSQPVTID